MEHFFHVPVGHLYVFFGEVSFQVLSSFCNWRVITILWPIPRGFLMAPLWVLSICGQDSFNSTKEESSISSYSSSSQHPTPWHHGDEPVLLSCNKEKWLDQIDTLSGSAGTEIRASILCISLLIDTREIESEIEAHECRGKSCDARDSLFIVTDEWGYLSGFPFCL